MPQILEAGATLLYTPTHQDIAQRDFCVELPRQMRSRASVCAISCERVPVRQGMTDNDFARSDRDKISALGVRLLNSPPTLNPEPLITRTLERPISDGES